MKAVPMLADLVDYEDLKVRRIACILVASPGDVGPLSFWGEILHWSKYMCSSLCS